MEVDAPSSIGPYVFQGLIGDGAFSVVRLVQERDSGSYYACKIVPRERIDSAHLASRFEQEIRINQQLHHPGIVEMYDLLSDEKNFYIVMEFCPNGDLFQFIVDRQNLTENDARPLFRQILETLSYIHSMGVSHRDIKPENLLIDRFGYVKISDFGLSRFIRPNGLVDTPCGSPCYASPECISGAPYNGVTTDVWSAGVILFAMLTGQLPWTKRNQAQLFKQIRRGEYSVPSDLSPVCQDFVRGLMTVDLKKRLTIEQALEHAWMRDVPPQFASISVPISGVSVRMVDEFFGMDHASVMHMSIPASRITKSCALLDVDALTKMLTTTGEAALPSIPSKKRIKRVKKVEAAVPVATVKRQSRKGARIVQTPSQRRMERSASPIKQTRPAVFRPVTKGGVSVLAKNK